MVAHQVCPGCRNQRRESTDEIEWIEDELLGAVRPGSPKLQHHASVLRNRGDLLSDESTPNLRPNIITSYRQALEQPPTPEELFSYWYAILHSEGYRHRYNGLLIRQFPRLPRPGSDALFQELVVLGRDLIREHLLEAGTAKSTLVGAGPAIVARGMPKYDKPRGRILMSKSHYFDGVSQDVWDYKIGSYPVCKKWLGARKGRELTAQDAVTFSRILDALAATLRIQSVIEQVVEAHGGWPDAFDVAPEADP